MFIDERRKTKDERLSKLLFIALALAFLFAACSNYQEEFDNNFGALEYADDVDYSSLSGGDDPLPSSSDVDNPSSSSVPTSSGDIQSSSSGVDEPLSSFVPASSEGKRSSSSEIVVYSSSENATSSSSSQVFQSSSSVSSSSEVSSSSSSEVITVEDDAGNVYPVVQIGEQYWMAKNLNYKTEGSACYDDQESNCELYGRLYTWEAAMTACPDGYRLPSRNDYTILWENADQMNGDSRPQDALWVNGTWAPSADNKTGFSAYPGGLWKGSYDRWLMDAFFWTSTPGEVYPTTHARSLHMNELNAYLGQDDPKTYMMSVRCIKDSQ